VSFAQVRIVMTLEHPLAIVLASLAIGAIAVGLFAWKRRQQRAQILSTPFPAEWRALLERMPLYQRLPVNLRHDLEPLIRAFLNDITFRGYHGLEITDEIRLTIAMQACLLVVHRDYRVYGDLHSVLVYPEEFVVEESEVDEAGVVTEGSRALSGQTLDTDKIVLSWHDVQEASTADEPYNVVLHEFAHYLDHIAGGALTTPGRRAVTDGALTTPAPLDGDAFGQHTGAHEKFAGARSQRDSHPGTLAAWHDVLEREYEALCDAVDRGDATLIDPYGAEDLAEFFAVATEAFFEIPKELEQRHAALYRSLRDFYDLDPAHW
jgi:Mlc titration factor MtfA (ptsG expression regulator)